MRRDVDDEMNLVFPIGRHSIMHTWVPDTRRPSVAAHGGDSGRLARTVYNALTAKFIRMPPGRKH